MKYTKEKFKKLIFNDKESIFNYPFISKNKRVLIPIKKSVVTSEFNEKIYLLSTLNDDFLHYMKIQICGYFDGYYRSDYSMIREISRDDEHNISGSDIIDTAIEILKLLDLSVAIIDDKSFLTCETQVNYLKFNLDEMRPRFHDGNIDLKLFRVLTEGESWYMSKGFYPKEDVIKKIIVNYGNTMRLANKNAKKLLTHPIKTLIKEMTTIRDKLYPKIKNDSDPMYYKIHYNMKEGLKILNKYSKPNDTISTFFKRLYNIDCKYVLELFIYLFENPYYHWISNRLNFPITIDKKIYNLTIYNYMIYIGNIYSESYLFLNLKI
jgi:hypothetical protein